MPPRQNSRYSYTTARIEQATNKLVLSPRIPFRYVDRSDNREHTVIEGETLWGLASQYFAALNRLPVYSAAMLYWVIQDYQPTPIHDPTIMLAPTDLLIIPDVNFVVDRILAAPDTRL